MCSVDILFWIDKFILTALLLDHCFTLFSWIWNWRRTTGVSVNNNNNNNIIIIIIIIIIINY